MIGKVKAICAGLGAAVLVILVMSGAGPTARAAKAVTPSSQPTAPWSAGSDEPLPFRGSIDRFVDQLGQGQINEAIDALNFGSGFDEAKRTVLRRNLSKLYGVVGKPRGHEVVALSIVSPSMVRAYVLAHYDDGVVLFHLTYWHRPGDRADDWRAIGYNVVTDMDEICKLLPAVPYHEPMHIPLPTSGPPVHR